MDAQRGFDLLLLAVMGLLAVFLLVQYLGMILGAILLAYLLGYPHRWLAPRIGDGPAAIGLILATTVLVVVPFVLLVGVAVSGLTDVAETVLGEEQGASLSTLNDLLGQLYGPEFTVESSITETLRSGQVVEILQTALEVVGGVSEAFISLTVLVVVSYYLLVDGDRLVAWIRSRLPMDSDERDELFERADRLMYAVVVGNVIIAVVDGLLVGVGLFVAGFSNVVFWTLISVFLALIPVVGSMIVWVPAAAYLLAVGEVVPGLLLLAYGFVVIGSVDNVLRPFVGANQAQLNPALFIVGIFSGLAVLGVMGLFFGPIVLGLAKHTYEVVDPTDLG